MYLFKPLPPAPPPRKSISYLLGQEKIGKNRDFTAFSHAGICRGASTPLPLPALTPAAPRPPPHGTGAAISAQ